MFFMDNFDAKRELALMEEWLAKFLTNSGKNTFVMGLSGGIDSAVVAMAAAQAVGEEHLLLVSMPYGHFTQGLLGASSKESVYHAQLVWDALPKARFIAADIAPTVDAEISSNIYPLTEQELNHICFANMKARVRAVRLRTLANLFDGLVLGTENRTENRLGYFTIGGDEETDVEILSNFLKTEVRALAAELGVPQEIQQKAPSADLWNGQTDEGELGFTYAQADSFISFIEGDVPLLGGMDAEIANKIADQMSKTAFKRRARPTYPRKQFVPPAL